MHLLKALRVVSRLESSPGRQHVFRDIAGRSAVIRLAVAAHHITRRLGVSHWLVAVYGLSWYLRAKLPAQTPRWLAIATLPNEIKHLDDLDKLIPEAPPARVRWSFVNISGWMALDKALGHFRDVRRFMGTLKSVEAKHNFMPACRVAETLFLYTRFRGWLMQHKVRAILVTSDYSPDAAALSAAAGALGIPRIYMPHALPSLIGPGRSPVDFDLYIFDSNAMRERFAHFGALKMPIVYRGVRGESRELQMERLDNAPLRFGIFLSGLTHMPVLAQTIAALKNFAPQQILLRGHPVAFANPNFTSLAQSSPEIKISSGTTLLQDADACDLVIAGNTTAFLEVLKYGVPAAYLAALDTQPYDYNGFVQSGFVPDIVSAEELDLAKIKTFFAPPWPDKLAYFDAAYGQNVEQLRRQVRQAIFSMIG